MSAMAIPDRYHDDLLKGLTRTSGQARIVQAVCSGWRTPAGIAKAAAVTVRTVQRAMNRYAELGLISRSVCNTRDGRQSAIQVLQSKVWKRLFFFDRDGEKVCEQTAKKSQDSGTGPQAVCSRVDPHRTFHRWCELFGGLISVLEFGGKRRLGR